MANNKRVEEIYSKLLELNQELNNIRDKCAHKETYYVENYQWRPASTIPATLCEECDMVIKFNIGLNTD